MATVNPTAQQQAAIAAQKAKGAQQWIHDIWTTQSSIQYTEARKVPHAEVDVALQSAKWEKEYEIPGKNTHVNILTHFY